jgi:syntaxin-binding protein 1
MEGGARAACRARLFGEVLGEAERASARGEWAVLVMDACATRVASSLATMSELMERGVSLVEDLAKRREPMPSQDAVYFISPTPQSLGRLIEDFGGAAPQYRAARVYLTSACPAPLLAKIKGATHLLPRLKALKEINLEVVLEDSRTLLAPAPLALECMYAPGAARSATAQGEWRRWASQLATVFATLGELPAVRYSASDGGVTDAAAVAGLARECHAAVQALARRSTGMPAAETCELLVLGRAFDPVAACIHEWTYEAMAYDLLPIRNGSVYRYDVQTNAGGSEARDAILGERDPMWTELRHLHLAEASLRLNRTLEGFSANNRAAQMRGGQKREVSTRDLKKMVQAMPQYRDQLQRLSLHIDIASKINEAVRARALKAAGEVEQDLVLGDATSKELIALLGSHGEDLSSQDKLRVLLCYAATHPEKLDTSKRTQWMKLARLEEGDMKTVGNLEHLGIAVNKKKGLAGMVNVGRKRRAKKALRKESGRAEEEEFGLQRFAPLLADVLDEALAGSLSHDEFPYVQPPRVGSSLTGGGSAMSGALGGGSGAAGGSTGGVQARASVRSARSTASWASRGGVSSSAEAAAGGGSTALSSLQAGGTAAKGQPRRRLFVLLAGGASRSEMRVVHRAAAASDVDVMLLSTSIESPETFLANLAALDEDEGIADF